MSGGIVNGEQRRDRENGQDRVEDAAEQIGAQPVQKPVRARPRPFDGYRQGFGDVGHQRRPRHLAGDDDRGKA